jgi:hypothetical protein
MHYCKGNDTYKLQIEDLLVFVVSNHLFLDLHHIKIQVKS